MNVVVIVKPNNKKAPLLEPQDDGSLVVYICEIAADGKANEALIKLLARQYNVAKSRVTIIRGHTSRYKVLSIDE